MLNSTQHALRTHIHQLLANKQLAEAHQQLVLRLQQNPHDHVSYFLLSEVNTAAGDLNKAVKLIEKALSIEPLNIYHLNLAKHLILRGEISRATVHYKSAMAIQHYSALELDTLANIATRLGYYDDALTFQQSAYQLDKQTPQISYNLAVALKVHGLFGEAKTLLKQLITEHEHYYQAHYSLAELNNTEEAKQHLNVLHPQAKRVHTASDQQAYFHSLALNYEHLNDYENAFKYFTHSKQAIAQQLNYQSQQHRQFCQTLMRHSTHSQLSPSNSDFAPVFVVGMPRSGTTLVEKILNQSDELQGIGELNDIAQLMQHGTQSNRVIDSEMFAKAYASADIHQTITHYQQRAEKLSNTLRSCDKQPFNFYYIDFILAAFPHAKIVCMQRNWHDCSVANYRQLYNPQSVFHHYSFTFYDIVAFHQDYTALATHFATKYPKQVYLQSYKQLVEEPIKQTQKLYAFCNLNWQASCLAFYKNNAASATASKKQIRQPLNKNSIGSWHNYAAFIDADLFQ
ncbi:tetratricopeptide repeat-containing sulfotransferase family protein [Pseudoalteromonas lipolytica]